MIRHGTTIDFVQTFQLKLTEIDQFDARMEYVFAAIFFPIFTLQKQSIGLDLVAVYCVCFICMLPLVFGPEECVENAIHWAMIQRVRVKWTINYSLFGNLFTLFLLAETNDALIYIERMCKLWKFASNRCPHLSSKCKCAESITFYRRQ